MDQHEIYHINQIALEGYDPVCYFDEGKARKGKSDIESEYLGLTWRFVSTVHRQLFLDNPEKYLPQYGGYCAFGASNGYKAKPKMDAFHIAEGKLYLNFAEYVQERWLEDVQHKINVADQKWPATKSGMPIKANRLFIYIKYRTLKLFGKDLFK